MYLVYQDLCKIMRLNEEVAPTPMVDCNREYVIGESSSSKKKTKH
jgi:predicted peptidase